MHLLQIKKYRFLFYVKNTQRSIYWNSNDRKIDAILQLHALIKNWVIFFLKNILSSMRLNPLRTNCSAVWKCVCLFRCGVVSQDHKGPKDNTSSGLFLWKYRLQMQRREKGEVREPVKWRQGRPTTNKTCWHFCFACGSSGLIIYYNTLRQQGRSDGRGYIGIYTPKISLPQIFYVLVLSPCND